MANNDIAQMLIMLLGIMFMILFDKNKIKEEGKRRRKLKCARWKI